MRIFYFKAPKESVYNRLQMDVPPLRYFQPDVTGKPWYFWSGVDRNAKVTIEDYSLSDGSMGCEVKVEQQHRSNPTESVNEFVEHLLKNARDLLA